MDRETLSLGWLSRVFARHVGRVCLGLRRFSNAKVKPTRDTVVSGLIMFAKRIRMGMKVSHLICMDKHLD